MREQVYQAKLIKEYEKKGWTVIKIIMSNKTGLPDLILCKPDECKFVEVKAKNGRLSKIQEYRIEELREKGFEDKVDKAPN